MASSRCYLRDLVILLLFHLQICNASQKSLCTLGCAEVAYHIRVVAASGLPETMPVVGYHPSEDEFTSMRRYLSTVLCPSALQCNSCWCVWAIDTALYQFEDAQALRIWWCMEGALKNLNSNSTDLTTFNQFLGEISCPIIIWSIREIPF